MENNNEINVFFDNKTFDLIGWQTKDIYQNLSITLLSTIQINQKISNNVFKTTFAKLNFYYLSFKNFHTSINIISLMHFYDLMNKYEPTHD